MKKVAEITFQVISEKLYKFSNGNELCTYEKNFLNIKKNKDIQLIFTKLYVRGEKILKRKFSRWKICYIKIACGKNGDIQSLSGYVQYT